MCLAHSQHREKLTWSFQSAANTHESNMKNHLFDFNRLAFVCIFQRHRNFSSNSRIWQPQSHKHASTLWILNCDWNFVWKWVIWMQFSIFTNQNNGFGWWWKNWIWGFLIVIFKKTFSLSKKILRNEISRFWNEAVVATNRVECNQSSCRFAVWGCKH